MKLEGTFKKIHQQEADVEALRRKVDEELKEQEERIALLLEQTAAQDAARNAKVVPKVQHVDPEVDESITVVAPPSAPSRLQESMNYWIRQLDKSDDDVLAQMESDLQGFLKELEPGLPTMRAIADANITTAVKAKQPLQKMQRAVTQAVAVTSASLRDGGVTKNSSREALWESFYAWETRNQK
jgi:DNA repair exonuclease SbcCD ATPase subunit